LALLSALLLAVSSWHISLSRGAFEASLTTFFLPLSVWFFLLGQKKPWLVVASTFFFSLNLFSYHSAKIVTPLILFFLIFWQRKSFKKTWQLSFWPVIISAIVLFLGFTLSVQSLLSGGGTRAADIGIFSGGVELAGSQRRLAVIGGAPYFLSRIYHNKLGVAASEFLENYLSYFSPGFIFIKGAGEATYGMMPGIGLLYLIELPFLLYSFYLIIKEKRPELFFFCFWLMVSPIPAALAKGVGYHANRVAVMMPAIQVLVAYGIIRFFKRFLAKSRWPLLIRKGGVIFLFVAYLISFSIFLEKYFFQAPFANAPRMGYGWPVVAEYLTKKENDFEKIIVSRGLSEPQAYLMFYRKMDPGKVQAQTPAWLKYEKEGLRFVDQLGKYNLGHYEFRDLFFPEDYNQAKTLLIGRRQDFPREKSEKVKQEKLIYYPDGEVAFVLWEI
jgi:hypothetical protein